MNEGKLYELQQDNTFSLFQVKYNPQADVKLGKTVDKQEPIEKKLMSSGHIIKKSSEENDNNTGKKTETGGFFKKIFGWTLEMAMNLLAYASSMSI